MSLFVVAWGGNQLYINSWKGCSFIHRGMNVMTLEKAFCHFFSCQFPKCLDNEDVCHGQWFGMLFYRGVDILFFNFLK